MRVVLPPPMFFAGLLLAAVAGLHNAAATNDELEALASANDFFGFANEAEQKFDVSRAPLTEKQKKLILDWVRKPAATMTLPEKNDDLPEKVARDRELMLNRIRNARNAELKHEAKSDIAPASSQLEKERQSLILSWVRKPAAAIAAPGAADGASAKEAKDRELALSWVSGARAKAEFDEFAARKKRASDQALAQKIATITKLRKTKKKLYGKLRQWKKSANENEHDLEVLEKQLKSLSKQLKKAKKGLKKQSKATKQPAKEATTAVSAGESGEVVNEGEATASAIFVMPIDDTTPTTTTTTTTSSSTTTTTVGKPVING